MCQKCVVCFYTRIAMTCAFVMTETPGNPRKPLGNPGKSAQETPAKMVMAKVIPCVEK